MKIDFASCALSLSFPAPECATIDFSKGKMPPVKCEVETKPKTISRRRLLRGGLCTIGTLIAGGKWATAVEPHWDEIERREMPLPRLEKAFDGYRIAQLSDIHMGDGMSRKRLDGIVQRTNALGADLIVITGDFVSGNGPRWAGDLTGALSQLQARDGVLAVLGNHDIWANARVIRRALRDAGIRELPNEVHILRRGHAQTFIVGADDPWCGKANIAPIARTLPSQGAAILLAHEPDFADEFSKLGRFDLQLSGHSHGGQVCAPFFGPIRLPAYGQKYPRGQYQVGDMILYTNRGVGASGIPVRFNCRPEISLFTLRAKLNLR
jgi:predicted MPP superfamily phosphohydrolase